MVKASPFVILCLMFAGCSGHGKKAGNDPDSNVVTFTLYSHQANGAIPSFETPGLLNCDYQIASINLRKHLERLSDVPTDWHRPLLQKEEIEKERYELITLTKNTFVPLPDSDWSEGHSYTSQEIQRAESAIRFARQHNRAAFQASKEQILRLCPRAQLDDDLRIS